jgi:hypothetical protein
VYLLRQVGYCLLVSASNLLMLGRIASDTIELSQLGLKPINLFNILEGTAVRLQLYTCRATNVGEDEFVGERDAWE